MDLRRKVEAFEEGNYRDDEDEHVIPISTSKGTSSRSINTKDVYPRRDGVPLYKNIRSDSPRDRFTTSGTGGNKNTLIFLGVLFVAIIFVTLLTYVFNSATITIIPKHVDVVDGMSKTFMFSLQEKEGSIPYIVATTTVTKNKKLPVSESKLVQTKASGKITIYNNYSTEDQRLIKNTRFESVAGKIYRIQESVVVPGKKGETPGSVDVVVYADDFGAEYNTGTTEFTIPGFKGSPQFDTFYAKSKGALSGGVKGNVSLVSKPDLDAAKDELAIEVGKSIRGALAEAVKEGYTPLQGAIKITYEDNEADLLSGQSSTYVVIATGVMPLAKEGLLASSVAYTQRDYRGEQVRLDYKETLTFTPKDTETIGTEKDTEILIEGKPRIVWITDTEALKELLKAKNKDEFATIMSGVSSIDRATNSVFPMWLSSFPDNVADITVEENLKAR